MKNKPISVIKEVRKNTSILNISPELKNQLIKTPNTVRMIPPNSSFFHTK